MIIPGTEVIKTRFILVIPALEKYVITDSTLFMLSGVGSEYSDVLGFEPAQTLILFVFKSNA